MRPRFRLPVSLTLALQSLAAVALTGCTPDSALAPPTSPPPQGVTSKQATTSARILVIVLMPTGSELVSMNDDGTDQRVLSGAFASVASASWAPDGKRILVSAAVDASSTHAIYTMNDDGTGITRLTVPAEGCGDFSPASLGKQIVFVRGCATASLAIMNADGTGITTLDHDIIPTPPAPSPKGALLAYAKSNDLWLLDVTRSTLTNLTNTPTVAEFSPAFSPSGKRIAFVRQSPTANSIQTMNIDGTMVTAVLSDATHSLVSPRWSPSGRQIAFATDMEATSTVNDVFVMNADGTGLTNLTRTPDRYEYPVAWARY